MIRSWDEMTGRNDWLIPASSSRPADGARNHSPTGSCPPSAADPVACTSDASMHKCLKSAVLIGRPTQFAGKWQ